MKRIFILIDKDIRNIILKKTHIQKNYSVSYHKYRKNLTKHLEIF